MKDDNDIIKQKFKLSVAMSKVKEEENMVMNKKRSFVSKQVGLVACACLLLTTGIVFARFHCSMLTHSHSADLRSNSQLSANQISYPPSFLKLEEMEWDTRKNHSERYQYSTPEYHPQSNTSCVDTSLHGEEVNCYDQLNESEDEAFL